MMDMQIKYGDLILLDFNPVKGREIAKIRPCIVVSNNLLNLYSPLFIVVPITSNITKVLPFHVVIKPSLENGLQNESKALTEQIKSLDKLRLVKKIGKLEKKYLDMLEQKILFVISGEN